MKGEKRFYLGEKCVVVNNYLLSSWGYCWQVINTSNININTADSPILPTCIACAPSAEKRASFTIFSSQPSVRGDKYYTIQSTDDTRNTQDIIVVIKCAVVIFSEDFPGFHQVFYECSFMNTCYTVMDIFILYGIIIGKFWKMLACSWNV